MAEPRLQLESLFVGIYAEIEGFMKGSAKVKAETDILVVHLGKLTKLTAIIGDAFFAMADAALKSVSAISSSVSLLVTQLTDGISTISTELGAFGIQLTAMLDTGATAASLALGRIGNFLNAITTTRIGRIGKFIEPLRAFTQGFKDSIAGLVTAEVEKAAQTLGRIGFLAGSLSRAKIDPAQVANLNAAMSSFFVTLQQGGTAAVGLAGTSIAAVARALKSISAINPASVISVSNALKVFLTTLASIPIPPNLPKIAALLTQIGVAAKQATKSIAGIGAGGAVPPVRNVSNAIAGTGSAAQAAGSRVGWFSGRLNNMATGASNAVIRLNTLRLGLAGLGGIGLSIFAKLDDSITKMLAHARIFPTTSTGEPNVAFPGIKSRVGQDLRTISSESIFTTNALAKALDLLTASGQSAGMGIESLRIAETFATASGMELETATKKLVDIQRSVGNFRIIGEGSGDQVQDYYKAIAKLGDLLVGVSRQVGSTEEQMTKAFTGHFINAMQRADMSIEHSLALLGIYSQVSADFRGSGGGDAVSRAINALTNKGVANYVQWQQLTSKVGSIFDPATRKLRPIDQVADILGKVFGDMGKEDQIAKLMLAGIQERRVAEAIQPIIGKGDEIRKLIEQMKDMGGIQKVVADMIRRDFRSQMIILWNNVSNAATVIGSHLAPAIAMLGKGIESLTKAFTNLNPALQNLIVWGVAFTLLIRPMIGLVTRLISSFVVGPILAITNGIWNLVAGLGSLAVSVYKALTNLGSVMWTVFSIPYKVLSGVASAVTSIVVSFAAGVVPFLANIALWMVFIVPVIAAIGAVVVTVFIGIVQMFSAIANGVLKIWDSVKSGAGEFAVGVADTMVSAGQSVAKMWDRAKPNAIKFMEDIGSGLKLIAGFLWNFQHNFSAVMKWLGENWNQLAKDMGGNFAQMIDNLIENMKEFGSLIYDIGKLAWDQFWRSAGAYAGVTFNWLRNEWSNILEDMSLLFRTFVKNLASNFMTILPVAGKLAKFALFGRTEEDVRNDMGRLKSTMPSIFDYNIFGQNVNPNKNKLVNKEYARLQEELKKIQSSKESMIGDMFDKLKGPFEGLNTDALKTSFAGLRIGMTGANLGSAQGLSDMWEKMSKRLEGTNFKNIFDKMVDTTAPLLHLLKLDLPTDPKKLIESLTKTFGLGTGTGQEAGEISGKTHPGFQFKQISLARTMLGGEQAESLDYQQLVTLRQIKDKFDMLIAIAQGKDIATGPRRSSEMDFSLGTPMVPGDLILGD